MANSCRVSLFLKRLEFVSQKMADIADAEVERQLRGHLESCHKLDKAEEILDNLDNSSHLLKSVKNKNTRTASLDGMILSFIGIISLLFYQFTL